MSKLIDYPSLKIGYLMQNGGPNLNTAAGPPLHVLAVINGLAKLGHYVRTVAIQEGKLGWADDVPRWQEPRYGLSHRREFRLAESLIRRTQFELKLPFFGLFDSIHYADACVQHLNGFDALYERYGYLGYGGLLAARRLGIPLILELNGNIVKEIDVMGVKMSAAQRAIGRWITWRTFQGADYIVVVSDALKKLLISRASIPADKISVVINGAHVERFLQTFDADNVRLQYGIGAEFTIVHVGSFQPWHGVDLLVSAFGLVQSKYPESQLVLIGEGPGRGSIIEQISKLGLTEKVILTGRLSQDQVAAVLSIADTVVAPYPYQHSDIIGTPLKLIEYMAAGKAIVASNAPIHEIIEDDKTGIRVPSADPVALAKGILRFLDDSELRDRLGVNARCQAMKYHTWDQVAQRTADIIWRQIMRQDKQRSGLETQKLKKLKIPKHNPTNAYNREE